MANIPIKIYDCSETFQEGLTCYKFHRLVALDFLVKFHGITQGLGLTSHHLRKCLETKMSQKTLHLDKNQPIREKGTPKVMNNACNPNKILRSILSQRYQTSLASPYLAVHYHQRFLSSCFKLNLSSISRKHQFSHKNGIGQFATSGKNRMAMV